MVDIIVGTNYSRLSSTLPPQVMVKLEKDLRYRPPGYNHTTLFKRKKWDGYNYLFDMKNLSFRTGLLERVCTRLTRDKIEFGIIDERESKGELSYIKSSISLGNIYPFDYQLAASESTTDITHGVIVSPTGTGKTIIMALVIQATAKKSLIVVNSRTLLDQTAEFFESTVNGGVGVIGAGDFYMKDITIATIQSLASILGVAKVDFFVGKRNPSSKKLELDNWLEDVGLIIHDEVHEADNDSVGGFYKTVKADKYIGMTATPFEWGYASEKSKNLEMEQHFGNKIFDTSDVADFHELGITVPLYIRRCYAPVLDRFKDYAGERIKKSEMATYSNVILKQVVENERRHRFITEIVKAQIEAGLSCYVYYHRISYGETLCEYMKDLDPVMLQGSTSRKVRQQTFKDMNDKKQLLVVSDIGSYGLNIRSLDSILLAFPSKDARQLKGRVCRAYPGKKQGVVFDIVDKTPYLYAHSKIRLNQYNKDNDFVIG